MIYPTDGILLIDKDEGESSYQVVRKVRKVLNVPKVGHAGTLDPFATGLLIILLGQGTKLSPFVMSEDKTYLATMRLGIETDTMDPTGRVVRRMPVSDLSLKDIQERAYEFVGNIEQTPPGFSAVRIKGTRAYKLARKGQTVALKKRNVTIHSLRILSVELPDVVMEVRCSSGTYIRSLAVDLGRKLSTVSHLCSLRRVRSGLFNVKNALDSKNISNGNFNRSVKNHVIPMNKALPGMEEIQVDHALAEKIRNGYQPALEAIADGYDLASCDGPHFKLISNDGLVAVVSVNTIGRDGHGRLKIVRVFN